jgi:hypothetical protein
MPVTFYRNKEFRELANKLDVEIMYSRKGAVYMLRHSPYGLERSFPATSENIERALQILRSIDEARAAWGSIQDRVQRVIIHLLSKNNRPLKWQRADGPFASGDEWSGVSHCNRVSYAIRLIGEQPLEVIVREGEDEIKRLQEEVIGRWGSDAWPPIEQHKPIGTEKGTR